jgi:3-methylcrotonyl-CoA carboxylase beta subunit
VYEDDDIIIASKPAGIAVDGPDGDTLLRRVQTKLAAEGKTLGEPEAAAIRAPVIAQYERQGHPYYASARLWDDGVIDPAQSRTVLALALAACQGAEPGPGQYGIFRM